MYTLNILRFSILVFQRVENDRENAMGLNFL